MSGDLLEKLRRGNLLATSGEFRLDPEKAREKLRLFRLPDPHRWVLEIVSAANLLGAQTVTFRIDADEVEAHFDGEVFEPEDLYDFYNAAFRATKSNRDIAIRQLAIGLTAAEGLNPQVLMLESGSVSLSLGPGAGAVVGALQRQGTRVYCKEKFRTSHVVEFFQNLRGNVAEKTYLRELCAFSTAKVVVDNKVISHGLRIEGITPAIPVSGPGIRGLVRTEPDRATSRIDYVQYGVLIETDTYSSCFPFRAVAESTALQRDMSNATFVRNDDFRALRHAITSAQIRSAAAFLETVHPTQWSRFAGLEDLYVQIIRACVGQMKRGEPIDDSSKVLLELLENYPIWPVADRPEADQDYERRAASAVVNFKRLRAAGKLYVSKRALLDEQIPRKHPVLLLTNRHVLNLTFDELETFSGFAIEDVTEELSRQTLIARNQAAWRSRPMPATLSESAETSVLNSRHAGYSISVAISHAKATISKAQWVKDGYLLVERTLPLPFDLRISGPLTTTENFDDIALDDMNKSLAFRAVLQVLELFDSLPTDVEANATVREAARATISALVSGHFHTRLLHGLGFNLVALEFFQKYARPTTGFALSNFASQGVTLSSVVDHMGALGQLQVFERVDARGSHSLDELVVAAQMKRLFVVDVSDRDKLFSIFASVPAEGTFIWVDAELSSAIYKLLGSGVRPGLDRITSQAYFDAFMRRPKVGTDIAQPDRYQHLGEFEKHGAHVKIAWREPGLGGSRDRMLVRYLFQDRILAERELPPVVGDFTVHIWGDSVRPTADYSTVDHTKNISKLEITVRDSAFSKVAQWLDVQLALPVRERAPRVFETLNFMILKAPKKVFRLPFITLSTGEPVSPEWVRKNSTTVAFSETGRVVEDLVPTSSPFVVVASRAHIEALFPDMMLFNCTAHDALVEQLERSRRRFWSRRVVEVVAPPEAVASAKGTGEGADAVVWMLRDSEPGTSPRLLNAEFLSDNRVVTEIAFEVPYGRFRAMVWGDAIQPDVHTYDRLVSLPEGVKTLVTELAQQCVRNYAENDPDLPTMFWYLWQSATHDFKRVWPDAHESLAKLPLFVTLRGDSIGYDGLLEIIHRRGVLPWTSVGESSHDLPREDVVVAASLNGNAVSLFSMLPWQHVLSRREYPAVARPQPDEGREATEVLDALRAAMLAFEPSQPEALITFIYSLTYAELEGKTLFVWRDNVMTLDVQHPVGRAIMDGEASMYPFAISSFFSTLTAKCSEFNRVVEARLQHALVKSVLNQR